MYKNLGFRNKFTKLKTAKKRKPSSNKWLSRQLNDPYVIKAKLDGYRSRAAYKLIEINDKFNILCPGIKIVDLGAAPGGWSQVAANIIKAENNIIAVDLLEMDNIPGVIFIQKDFHEPDAADMIISRFNNQLIDVVLSDMAANAIGHGDTDHLRIIDLCYKSLDFALKILKPGGHFVAKILRGGTETSLLTQIKQNFKRVKHFKPLSSRKDSKELYIIALDKKTLII